MSIYVGKKLALYSESLQVLFYPRIPILV